MTYAVTSNLTIATRCIQLLNRVFIAHFAIVSPTCTTQTNICNASVVCTVHVLSIPFGTSPRISMAKNTHQTRLGQSELIHTVHDGVTRRTDRSPTFVTSLQAALTSFFHIRYNTMFFKKMFRALWTSRSASRPQSVHLKRSEPPIRFISPQRSHPFVV